jgi:hypothetical protein
MNRLVMSIYLICFVTFALSVNAESMMEAFTKFKNTKSNNGGLPGHLKGVVCERSGSKPKSIFCYNKHGVRCSPEFLNEKHTCKPSVPNCARRGFKLEPGQTCQKFRMKDSYNSRTHGPCNTKGDIAKIQCPQPCGCVLEGEPKRESDGMMRTKTIPVGNSGCSSGDTWNKVKEVIHGWNVPQRAHKDFEMGAMMDRATFLVFDLFIQPEKNRARYSLSLGAVRCHGNNIEIGYMYTGMWKVDTINTYRCHHRGGLTGSCKDSGIPPESIEKARKALQWYAWKNLQINSRRRLTMVGDKQLQVDNQEEEEERKTVVPTRRSLRGDFFSVNDGDIEENEADTRTFVDTLDTMQDGWFKGLDGKLKHCPIKQCTSWQKYSCGLSTTCQFCTSCSRCGYRGGSRCPTKGDRTKRDSLFDTFDSIGCPQENCLQWKRRSGKSGQKGKAYCAYCAGPEGIRDNYFDRLASGDGRFDSLQECPMEKCLQWKTRHGKSGTKAYCVYCAGDGSSLPEGFRRL